MSANFFKPGAHNVICDRTGFKIKSTNARKEWNGRLVRKKSWEPRQPQDLIEAVPESPGVRDARPRPADRFLETNEVTPESL